MLKRKAEEERRRREEVIWREASRTPNLLGKRIEPPREKGNGAGSLPPGRRNATFFSKLRQGRLLG
jgi:hypothetical protein